MGPIKRGLENKTKQHCVAKTQMQPNFPIKHFYMSYCFQNNQPSTSSPECNNNTLSKELLNLINSYFSILVYKYYLQ